MTSTFNVRKEKKSYSSSIISIAVKQLFHSRIISNFFGKLSDCLKTLLAEISFALSAEHKDQDPLVLAHQAERDLNSHAARHVQSSDLSGP